MGGGKMSFAGGPLNSDDTGKSKAWLVLAFGDDRQYTANRGYEDEISRVYHYDSFVQNHLQVQVGDLLIIRDRAAARGLGRVERIITAPATKERSICPSCGAPPGQPRRSKHPTYRCRKGHEFDSPRVQHIDCQRYEAQFEGSFVPLDGDVSLDRLRAARLKAVDQMSIQPLDVAAAAAHLRTAAPAAIPLLDSVTSPYFSSISDEEPAVREAALSNAYEPNGTDTRAVTMRHLRARLGQPAFRKALFDRYGARCMVTGCGLDYVLEAAHISPYRGAVDQHPENGLLLRSDVHTLFDLDLVGIEPDHLTVRFHPSIASMAEYLAFEGASLRCEGARPSRLALLPRWAAFQVRARS
jgi:putative restriction endonuclease